MGANSGRLKLKEAADRLLTRDVAFSDTEFWNGLWDPSLSAEDIFEAFGPQIMESMLLARARNLKNVISLAVAQLCQFVETPLPMYTDNALNCIRVLTRVLPVVNEARFAQFRKDTFWKAEDAESEPLARLLIHAVMHLCFVPGFTIDEASEVADSQPGRGSYQPPGASERPGDDGEQARSDDPLRIPFPRILWFSGVGSTSVFAHSKDFDAHRIEVLRLLIAILSEPVFLAPTDLAQTRCDWAPLVTAMDSPFASSLFCSLLNAILQYTPSSWVPYANALVTDNSHALVDASSQVLAIMLDNPTSLEILPATGIQGNTDKDEIIPPQPGGAPKVPEQRSGNTQKRPAPQLVSNNVFQHLVRNIKDGPSLTMIYDAFVRLLTNVYESVNTLLPGSTTQISCHRELLIVLWKILTYNPHIEQHIVQQCDPCKLVVPLCFMMFDSRRDTARVGLIHLCTFLLLRLSGDREFCIALNKPFSTQLPVDLPAFTGSHADLVMLTVHKLIVNGIDGLRQLHQCLLIIAANISPYVRNVSIVTAVKLMNLFEVLTSPKYLFAKEENHHHAVLLLDLFNNVVQYQFGSNPHLVYAMVKRAHVFQSLFDMTLESAQGIAQQHRADVLVRLEMKMRKSGPVPPPAPPSRPPSGVASAPVLRRAHPKPPPQPFVPAASTAESNAETPADTPAATAPDAGEAATTGMQTSAEASSREAHGTESAESAEREAGQELADGAAESEDTGVGNATVSDAVEAVEIEMSELEVGELERGELEAAEAEPEKAEPEKAEPDEAEAVVVEADVGEADVGEAVANEAGANEAAEVGEGDDADGAEVDETGPEADTEATEVYEVEADITDAEADAAEAEADEVNEAKVERAEGETGAAEAGADQTEAGADQTEADADQTEADDNETGDAEAAEGESDAAEEILASTGTTSGEPRAEDAEQAAVAANTSDPSERTEGIEGDASAVVEPSASQVVEVPPPVQTGGGVGSVAEVDGAQLGETADSEVAGVPPNGGAPVGMQRPEEKANGEGFEEPAARAPEEEDLNAKVSEITYIPTRQWLESFKAQEPLVTIQCLLAHLGPKVARFERLNDEKRQEHELVEFLENTTLVGLLPTPHNITIRRYQENQFMRGWFTAYLWGTVFIRNQDKLPLFDGERIKLFRVTTATPPP